ncbi:hypothetical protein KR222_002325, partial [Zaprionus bogoriensis]
TASADVQSQRASRIANSRNLGSTIRASSSTGINFNCPEEFGYYPHPTDCTQYYVCVFGGALLESCTGGLMYSHELQTCDWPRNVGCELIDSGTSSTSTELGSAPRNKVQQQQEQQQQQHHHVPSRVRFGSAFTSPAATQKTVTVPPQYHRSPQQIIQAQVQHIPPPPELREPPNPVITSRGQPKSLLDSQEEIAKLYAEAQETLPPLEEEISDRQQRVYRGQPSTVSQVQRDRDGIIHQASINAIPNHGKIGSYTFGTAYRAESSSPSSQLAQTSDNIFVQPSSQAPPPQLLSNRNYYNASIYNHGVDYQTPQQAQNQQPTPFKQPQQQQQPSSFDSSYYSVYDDDVDLYRDIEYQQQQEQQQHLQQQQQQQFQSTVRQQQQQPTYRPFELLTTPTPVQRPTYNDQPVLSYSTDYDENLNAQIEHDNVYEQPTSPPQRTKDIKIQTLEGQSAVTTTPRPSINHDMRNYYNTLTMPNGSYEEGDYNYSSSSEDYFPTDRTTVQNSDNIHRHKSIETDNIHHITNDITQSTMRNHEKYTKTTVKTTTAPTHSSTLRSTLETTKIATKGITTTTTHTITKPSETTTKLPILSSKTHVNNNFKQNVIIKLKSTTETPRPKKAPSPKTTSSTTSTPIPLPVTTYNSNPFLKSKLQILAKSLVQAVSLRESPIQVINGNSTKTLSHIQAQPTLSFLPPPTNVQRPLVDDSANHSIPNVETIHDESKNVEVQSTKIPNIRAFQPSSSPKFLDFINAAAYGNSKVVQTSTEKSLYDSEYNGPTTKVSSSAEQNQSQRIQTYVVSEVKPQSFRTTTGNPGKISSELLDSSSTTLPNNHYQYSLQSGTHGFTLKSEHSFNKDDASELLFQREDNWHQLQSNTTTITTTRMPKTTHLPPTQVFINTEEYEDILPTTYAPLRIWRNGRPTIKQKSEKLITIPTVLVTEPTKAISTPTTRASVTLTSSTTSSERAVPSPSYTARANLPKENPSRVTSNPAARFVSPYKSLESLLQDERGPQKNLRVTARSRYASGPAAQAFLQTTPKSIKNANSFHKNNTQSVIATMATSNVRNFSISDAILSSFSYQKPVVSTTIRTTTLRPNSASITTAASITAEPVVNSNILIPTVSTIVTSSSIQVSEPAHPRGRSRYTAATINYSLDSVDEPTTYAPKLQLTNNLEVKSTSTGSHSRRKIRGRITNSIQTTHSESTAKSRENYESYKETLKTKEAEITQLNLGKNAHKRYPVESKASIVEIELKPQAEALIAHRPLKQDNIIDPNFNTGTSGKSFNSPEAISDRPSVKFLYSNKYRQQTAEHTLADSLQNAGYIKTENGRSRFRTLNVLEQLHHFLSASDSDESGSPQFVDEVSASEITAEVSEIPTNLNVTTMKMPTSSTMNSTTTRLLQPTTHIPHVSSKQIGISSKLNSHLSTSSIHGTDPSISNSSNSVLSTFTPSTTLNSPTFATSSTFVLPTTRASRVNNALKSSIAAAVVQSSSPSSSSSPSTYQISGGRAKKFQYGFAPNNNNNNQHQYNNNNAAVTAVSVKCSDSTLSAKCNEIPSRNNNRNRGSTIYTNQEREAVSTPNRGTHPPRTRPTLKPSGTIVSKAQEFVDIYRYPPTRPEPLYPQPTPDKTAAKCRKDVCLLPDCYCGGKDIPGELQVESIPQIVLLTFDDSVNDLNKQLYTDLFEKGRVNPNGCPIAATFYVSHEWTDYSQVQNLYADGHEMASHTVSHSFGEQFSQKKWTREIAGQREILAAYGGVKLSDVRGMRAPFLSVGGNKMYKMLYDSNFTYDSSMPVYENRPPSWPYTLDYKIFHDCMIPPCPTRSYPGVWQVPMVMWQDLNGGRCSMGDACSNPSDAEGVTKMIMKNFERHYTTNRAPFGLFYHAAWFTQPHHKEGFIKFLDTINAMPDVWIITNWQALQWVRDPTPTSRINSFQPFQCDYSDRPKRCNNPKVCNLWHKSGVRYMKTCQPCPDIYPWTGKSGIRSSRIDNDVEEPLT